MKTETRLKKLKGGEATHPLMKRIVLERYYGNGLTEETLNLIRKELERLSGEVILDQLIHLDCGVSEIGSKEPTSLAFTVNLIRQFLTLPEVQESVLKAIRG